MDAGSKETVKQQSPAIDSPSSGVGRLAGGNIHARLSWKEGFIELMCSSQNPGDSNLPVGEEKGRALNQQSSSEAETPEAFPEEPGLARNAIVPLWDFDQMPVVGLGGSAGGLAALQDFFAAMPCDGGMAFVVIMHLAPEHESILAEVLQRSTAMPVLQVQSRVKVEPNHVYVIPPAKLLSMEDGHVSLSEPALRAGRHVTVDLFFRTLADTHGPRAAAIVLSGADGDGAIGIKRVKELGGLAVAQEPREAGHEGMPRSAIATGMVDWVLPVAEMPAKLLEYWRTADRLHLPPEDCPAPDGGVSPSPSPDGEAPANDEAALRDVLAVLKARTGHDFSYYKRATVLRRIGRRLQVNGIENLTSYLGFLRAHPGEAESLLQDLLISVTNFFRDREVFAALESRIPALFRGKGPEDTVRVWVAACATGEEAYSIAMLLCEHAEKLAQPPKIQVFATDLNEGAVQAARGGAYPETIAADVSEGRLRRFFFREHGGYRIKRELREVVLFALHDLLKDSPFSRLDMVTCRNLLIYFNREAQTCALEIFSFALRAGGTLFLGTSESVDEGSPLFSAIDKKRRIYARRSGARPSVPFLPGPSTLAHTLRQTLEKKAPVPMGLVSDAASPVSVAATSFPSNSIVSTSGELPVSLQQLHFELLEHLAPPSVVVSREFEVLHVSPHAGQFLQVGSGELSRNLLDLVHPMLRLELRSLFYRAEQAEEPAGSRGIPIEHEGGIREINLRVGQLRSSAKGCFVVIFEEQNPAEDTAQRSSTAGTESEPLIHHLEQELAQAKAQLRDTLEQADASGEEQKASNEELQASNEELRSATEELETGREELQSTNEELSTVNQELKSKVEELGRSNSDLASLMASTQIATIFLDRSLSIQRYTPPAVALFNLRPTDLGRPLSDLTSRLNYPDLAMHAQRVLEQLGAVELEVAHQDGRYFLARILPYRTTSDHITGVVLTFVDVSERKKGEASLAESLRQLEQQARIFDTTLSGIADFAYIFDRSGRFLYANRALADLLGLKREEIVGKNFHSLPYPAELAAKLQDQIEQVFSTGKSLTDEMPFTSPTGQGGVYEYIFRPVLSADGSFVEFVGGSTRDITARKRAEAAQMNFRQIFESAPGNYVVIEPDSFKVVAVSDEYLRTTMTERAVFADKTIFEVFPDNSETQTEVTRLMHASFARVKATRRADAMAVNCYSVSTPEGVSLERWWSPSNSPIFGEGGELAYIIHRVEDVTAFIQRKRAEGRELDAFSELEDRTRHLEADIVLRGQELQRTNEQLRSSEEKYRILFNAMDEAYYIIDLQFNANDQAMDYRIVETNPAFEKLTGLKNAAGKTVRELVPEIEESWIEQYGQVALTGRSQRFSGRAGSLGGRWYEGFAFRVAERSPHTVAIVFSEITDRKRAELNAEFLASVTADLARLSTIDEMMGAVGKKIGTHFNLSVCGFFEIDDAAGEAVVTHDWHRDDVPSLIGTYRIGDFLNEEFQQACRTAQAFVVRDTATDPRADAARYAALEVGAFVSLPIVRDEVWRFLLVLFTSAPRDWREDEIALMYELTRRLWINIERRRAEEALRRSEEHLRLVAESARDFAIFTLDDESIVTSWNSGAEALFGYSAGEIVGCSGMLLCAPEDRLNGRLEEEKTMARREGRAADERWHCRKDGSLFWGSGSLVPLCGNSPCTGADGFLMILSDRTEARTAQETLEQSRREVETASQAKDHFMAVLSHELRTPLTPVLMAVNTISRRKDLPESVLDALQMIRRNIMLESHFIDDLLDLTRISKGKIELVRTNMDLHESIRRAVEVCNSDVEGKRQRLTVSLEAENSGLNGDFARLQQAFWNLLKNASKFTPNEGSICIRIHGTEGWIVVEMTDTGIGMEADVVNRIFNPFEQADISIARQFGGLGLGLAIAKATIEAHGGTLNATSPGRGQGATFIVRLPLQE